MLMKYKLKQEAKLDLGYLSITNLCHADVLHANIISGSGE